MKFIFCFLLITVFSNVALFSQCPNCPCPSFGVCLNDGHTKATAYQIWTLAHLLELRDSVNNDLFKLEQFQFHFGKHFRLMQDIATVEEVIAWRFRGAHFHGGGHKITVALNYNPQTFSDGALFMNITDGGSIDSLTVDGYINGGFAGIVGTVGGAAWNNFYPASTVTNCTSNATIVGGSGIAFSNSGIISNCVFNGSITGVNIIGGIVGRNDMQGQVINCINNGKIVATNSGSNTDFMGQLTAYNGVGGIVGAADNGNSVISHNINIGIVEGQGFVGGILGGGGNSSTPSNIMNNANYGFVKGINGVGGIFGSNVFNTNVSVTNNSNFGVVVGNSETGCIVGRNNGGTISNNHYDKQMCGQ